MKKNLMFIVLLLSVLSYGQGENFYVSTDGSDLNDGKSEAMPWKTLAKVQKEAKNFKPGDVIAFKRGDTWNDQKIYRLNHPSGTSSNYIRYTAYGTGLLPVLNIHTEKKNLNWVKEGNNLWSTSSNRGRRVFKNGKELLLAQYKANVGSFGTEYFHDGSKIFVHSTTNPSSDKFSWSKEDYLIRLDNADYIIIENLNLRGSNGHSLKIELNNNNWIVRNCKIGWNASNGLKIAESTNILVENCTFDSNFLVDMAKIPAGGTGVDVRGCSDGIYISRSSEQIEIKNCSFKNWGHTALGSSPKSNTLRVTDVSFHDNEISTPDILYGRAIGYSGYFEDNEIFNNYIHDISTSNQLGGSRNHFHHNIINRVRDSPLKNGPLGRGIMISNYNRKNTDNIIENNVIANTESEGIHLNSVNYEKPGEISGNIIRNNIVYNCGSKTGDVGIQFHEDKAGQLIFDNEVKNNLIYNSSAIKTFRYMFNGSRFSGEDFNSKHSKISGNISADPLFMDIDNGNYSLQNGSPAIDAGITPLATMDYIGNTIGANPDIGLYEMVGTGSIDANAGSDVSVCEGENTTLTASGGTSYVWSTGATTQSISVSPNSTTTYSVTASDGSGNSDTDDVIVTVTNVTANAGRDVTIDEGNSTTLTATGGDTYLWSTGATTPNITVSPSATGIYTVTATKNGCDDSDSVQITVNPTTVLVTANAGPDVSICTGDSTTLTASGGSSYVWSTGATTQSISVSPNATQTYTVTVSDGSGNSDTDDVIVTVINVTANASADVVINNGENTTLTASGGDTYLWSNGATTQSTTVNPSSTQNYSVVVTKNGCDDSDNVTVTVNSVSSINANAGSDVYICDGKNTTLTASGGSSYVWSTGATTQSITVSPNATQTYTVTASDSSGNSDTDDVIVTVTNVTANAGRDVAIDEGNSTTLTATGGDTYLWSTGATTPNITVSPSATGIYTVTATKNGCDDSDSVQITVNPTTVLVTANAGPDVSICTEDSTTLTASGGSSYIWSTGATTQSISVSPNATQTYTVTVSDGSGNSDTDDVIVTVINVTANAGQDKTIEEGESVKLTASGGTNYLWSTGETTKSISVSPIVTFVYSVSVFDKNCSDSDEVKVIVNAKVSNPSPANAFAGDDMSICLGESVSLSASGGDSYTWDTGETTESIEINPTRTTTYVVHATRGGTTDTDTVVVTVENCSSGLNESQIDDSSFVIYPNPTEGDISLSFQNAKEDFSILVVDLKGSIVYKDELRSIQKEIPKKIDLSRLTKGVYFVRLVNPNKSLVKKIICL